MPGMSNLQKIQPKIAYIIFKKYVEIFNTSKNWILNTLCIYSKVKKWYTYDGAYKRVNNLNADKELS